MSDITYAIDLLFKIGELQRKRIDHVEERIKHLEEEKVSFRYIVNLQDAIKALEDKVQALTVRIQDQEGMTDDESEALERERSSWEVP